MLLTKYRFTLTLSALFVVPFLNLLLCPNKCHSQIILTEIMFDPIGNENYDEFIEIYNASRTDTVDLANWQISDGSGSDHIISHKQGTKLNPLQFGLILDPGYFENSTLYNALIPQSSLILTIDNSTFGSSGLSNSSAEPVILISTSSDTIARYLYSLDNEPGFSDEKIFLITNDVAENWGNSRTINGTPGAINSLTPSDNDLALLSITSLPVKPLRNDEISILAVVQNVGRNSMSGFQLLAFVDSNHDTFFQSYEQIGDTFSTNHIVNSSDSVIVKISFFAERSGIFPLLIKLLSPSDTNAANDSLIGTLSIGFPENVVVINEIMYSPQTRQPEWFELFNCSETEVDLQHWSVADSDSSSKTTVSAGHFSLPAGSFAIVTEDSSILEFFTFPPDKAIVLSPWPSLNNSNDHLFLFDQNKNIIDQVYYFENWGGDIGVSLERINPSLASNDANNWHSCVALTGGTPGGPNSIFVEVLPAQAALSVSPNPFSPNNDGMDDVTIISYNLPFNLSQVQVKIYDVRGRLIRLLVNNQTSGVSNSIIWDGRDKDSNICRMGIYIIYLEAIHYQQGVVKALKTSVVLAQKL